MLGISMTGVETQVQALIASNDDMRSELAKLNSTVQRLVHDNKELQAGQKISQFDNFSPIVVRNNFETGAGLKLNETASKEKMPPRNVTREAVESPKFYRPNVYI